MLLEFSTEERVVLASLVQREIDELGPEIHHTDSRTYRDDLKARRELLVRLLDRLGVPQAVER